MTLSQKEGCGNGHTVVFPIAVAILWIGFSLTGCALKGVPRNFSAQHPEPLISDVSAAPGVFNPTANESVAIHYTLSEPATVTVKLYNPYNNLIRTFIADYRASAGPQEARWDGRDEGGAIVPDEAYTYTIVARDKGGKDTTYDPTDTTQGRTVLGSELDFLPMTGEIQYRLPEPARVRIRIGIAGEDTPLLRTLFDWVVRPASLYRERWDGYDDTGTIPLIGRQDMAAVFSGMSLSLNSVIVQSSPRHLWQMAESPTEATEVTAPNPNDRNVHADHPRAFCHEPSVQLEVVNASEQKAGLPSVKGKVSIRMTIDPNDTLWMRNNLFGLTFFVDHVAFFKDMEGATPLTYEWDTRGLTEGMHLLSVNVWDYQGHIGTRSLNVFVEREPDHG